MTVSVSRVHTAWIKRTRGVMQVQTDVLGAGWKDREERADEITLQSEIGS
jgi:hypothetical protein